MRFYSLGWWNTLEATEAVEVIKVTEATEAEVLLMNHRLIHKILCRSVMMHVLNRISMFDY